MKASDPLAEQLVRSGRAALLEEPGDAGAWLPLATVSFVEEPGGSLLVAAGSPSARWAERLLLSGRCRVTAGDRQFPATVEPLEGAERAAAIRALILEHGTPSERLGAGPAFRLWPPVPPSDASVSEGERPGQSVD